MPQVKLGNCKLTRNKSAESYILLMWLVTSVVLSVAKFVMARANVFGLARTIILWALSFAPIIFLFVIRKDVPQKRYRFFLFIFSLSVLSFILTACMNPKIGYFYTRESYGLGRVLRPDSAIFALLFFGIVADKDDLFETVREYAYIDFICLLVLDFLPALMQGGWEDISYSGATVLYKYNLSFGYSMTLPVVVFLYVFIKEKKVLNLILALIGMALIFTNGSRGALLIPIAFIGLMIICNIIDSRHTSWKIVKIAAVLICMLAILLLGGLLLDSFVTFLSGLGIKSRTLDLLSNGKITNDSGRNDIWMAVIQGIKEGGIFGYGAFGDRPFVFPLHFVGYSHNIILEMICSFGIIGAAICLLLIVGSARMIFCCKDTLTRELFIIFFSVSLQLMLSFSFWYVWEFWAAIAIANNYFKSKKSISCQKLPAS